MIIRPRSALGLKYIEITPGESDEGFAAGDTIPAAQATPEPVEIDEVFNTFDVKARRGSQRSLDGFGTALAGRGDDINEAIVDLRAAPDLPPAGREEPRRPGHAARALLPGARATRRAEVAPVAEAQASLFVNLDTTFTALASVARPFIQESISNSPPAEDAGDQGLPAAAAVPAQLGGALPRAEAGRRRCCPTTRPILADALEIGTDDARAHARVQRAARGRVRRARGLRRRTRSCRAGIERLNDTVESLRPTLDFITPAQTVCNYATLWFRNISSLLSVGDKNGTWQRFIIIATPQGPNNEGGPSSAPANGGGPTHGELPAREPVPEHGRAGPDARVRGGQRGLQGRQAGRSATCRATRAPRPTARWRGRADAAQRPAQRARRRSRSARSSSWSSAILVYLGFAKDIPFVNPPYELKAVVRRRAEHVAPARRCGSPGVEVGKVTKVEEYSRRLRPDGRDDGDQGRRPADPRGRRAEDPAAHLPRGQLLRRARPGHAVGARARRRRHDPGGADERPVQLDEVLTSLQSDTRATSRSCSRATATRSTASRCRARTPTRSR